jgi:hypothetical protein
MFIKKPKLNSKPNNPNARTLPQEVCDSLSKSSARCNLRLTWDQTNFFASKSLASGDRFFGAWQLAEALMQSCRLVSHAPQFLLVTAWQTMIAYVYEITLFQVNYYA